MYKKITFLLIILSFLMTSGFGCKTTDPKALEGMKPVTLTYWRVWDDSDAFDEIIAKYKTIHPNIKIEYKKLRYDEFEKELTDALAEDRGPDMFSIQNTWVEAYENKISPMPSSITLSYPVVKGTIQKEIVPELRTTKSITLNEIKNNFIDTVYKDVVLKVEEPTSRIKSEKIFGLPISIDTLVMYFNRDLFNNAGIPNPPKYWNKEFQQDVKKLTRQDTKGQIEQSGAALGGSDNINRYSDILSVLMMQNGANMINENNVVLFDRIPSSLEGKNYNPGLEALRFYTDFANPAKEVYAWNSNLNNSLDMFIQGKLAMMFGYAYMLPQIKTQAPKLNFSISSLPQIEGNTKTVNFANYWVETVSKKSKYQNESWDFIQFITKADQAKLYINKTKKPTALRSLINYQLEDNDMKIFAEQILTANSWYHGKNALAAEKIIGEMIDLVTKGQDKIENIITVTARKVQQTIK